VLWVKVSGRCGFAFGAGRENGTGRRKTVGWKEILARERRGRYNEEKGA